MNAVLPGLFEEVLARGCDIRVRVTGRSMRPFLVGGEVVTIRRTDAERIRCWNLIFFRNRFGQAVMHRVIRRGPRQVQTLGDGLRCPDPPVNWSEVLGLVVRVEGAPSPAAWPAVRSWICRLYWTVRVRL